VFVFLGLMKVLISFVKYLPQVYLNWSRKTTTGWSLENVLLDFTGGTFSFAQIFIDWIESGATSQFSGGLNIAKFLLSMVSMGFDCIFLFQHYILYPHKKASNEEDERKKIDGSSEVSQPMISKNEEKN
jgi:cystinosin